MVDELVDDDPTMIDEDSNMGNVSGEDKARSPTTSKHEITINEFYNTKIDSLLDVIKNKRKANKSNRRDEINFAKVLKQTSRHDSIDYGSILKFNVIYPSLIRANYKSVPVEYKSDSLYKIMKKILLPKSSLRKEKSHQSIENRQPTENAQPIENPRPTENRQSPENPLLISEFWVLKDGCIPKSSFTACPEGALDGQLLMENLAALKNELCK